MGDIGEALVSPVDSVAGGLVRGRGWDWFSSDPDPFQFSMSFFNKTAGNSRKAQREQNKRSDAHHDTHSE